MSACEMVDVLDKVPAYQADLDGAITDPKTVELALTGVYANMPGESSFNALWIYVSGSFKAGLMEKPSWWTRGNAVYYYERYWPVLSGSTDYDWDSDYTLIKNANFLLEAIEDIEGFSGNRKNEIIGELHFLRAFAYERLLLRFGQYWNLDSELGVIVRNELPSLDNIIQQRSTVQQTYDLILEDLDIAIANCPAYTNLGYASDVAAKGYKARTLFLMGRYDECITLVDDIITNYPANQLAQTYGAVFTPGADSKEILFGRAFGQSEISNAEYYRINAFASGKWGPSANFIQLLGDDPTDDIVDPAVDPRYYDIIGDKIEVNYTYGVAGNVYENYTVKKLYASNNDLPLVFMRTAELYLMKAEAIYRKGGSYSDAYAPVAAIRNRAGATEVPHATEEEIAAAICNEWLIELSFENNLEYLAIRRFGVEKLLEVNSQLNTALNAAIASGPEAEAQYRQRIDDFRILPIPTSELNSNPVDQNPGY